jgi:hypothetical protein
MRILSKLSVVALSVLWPLLAVSLLLGACGGHYTGWPFATPEGPGQLEYGTLGGDEVAVSCPVEFQPPDPTEWAQILEDSKTPYATPWLAKITPLPRETALPTGSLGALLPADPITGELPGSCLRDSNAEVGCQYCGFFAGQAELDRLGRVCGCDITGGGEDGWRDYFDVRADLYLTTPGAREAFRMESDLLQRAFEFDVENVDQARLEDLGDERIIKQDLLIVEYKGNETRSKAQQALLVRWHNIVVRMELSPYKPTELLLDYAEQLGRNIEATANSGG